MDSTRIGNFAPVVVPSLVAWAIGAGLRGFAGVAATTAVGGFSLLAVLVYVADEHPTFKAGVVRLYGVVVLLSRWVRRLR